MGIAQVEITPPLGFPIAGYYHERLATGQKDPLWAKAVVFQQGDTQAAWVACDLTGIAIDLSTQVRRRAAEQTGIPAANIVVSATHSHTAPDYTKSLYLHLGPQQLVKTEQDQARANYAGQLIANTVQAIINAQQNAQPAQLLFGTGTQEQPISFCRRFVMRDGSVRTWVGLKHPEALRSTAPIDPEVGLLQINRSSDAQPIGLLSSFALHLDTVGGMEWSADYPYYLQESVRAKLGPDVVSIFGTGTCGDINHAEPTGQPRNSTSVIGNSLGATVTGALSSLKPIDQPTFQVRSCVVPLPLEEVSPADIQHSLQMVQAISQGEKADFFDHVTAYKRLVLDRLWNKTPVVDASQYISLGLTHQWAGVGEVLPIEVTVMTLGSETAIVFLPGEIFVELGLAIKHASPFKTTLIVELSQAVETIYIPNRQAYAGGGYEVTNSLVQPGSGEMLVEAAVGLLRDAATEQVTNATTAAK
ncbi:hypothetical protein GC163_18710 [bacterium]|nr:hypothetical protein [bacterium]